METPNIQLYNLFRQDLHLTDGKSLELMHLLNKEYKSGVKEDIAALGQSMDTRFQSMDTRFQLIDTRFQSIEDCLHAHDQRFEALDNKIDKNFATLDNKIDRNFATLDSKIDKSFSKLDSKIDLKTAELRTDIHKSHASIIKSHTTWMITVILAIIGMIIASFFKK